MKILSNILSPIAGILIIFGVYSGKYFWSLIGLIPLIIVIAFTFFKTRKQFANANAEIVADIEQLKANGEKIAVDFDNCEIKDSSYSQDLIDERMTRFSTINLDYGKVIGKEHVSQSLLVYNYTGSNGTEKFIQAFSCGKESLKVNFARNQITLYVDKYNRSRYYFELNSH